MKLPPKTSIVTFLDNHAEWALLFWAGARLDYTFVPLSPQYLTRTDELSYMLNIVKAGAIVVANDDLVSKIDDTVPLPLQGIPVKIVVD